MLAINESPEWKALRAHFEKAGSALNLKELFDQDKNRASNFSTTIQIPNSGPLLFDYSKHLITKETVELLVKLAQSANLEAKREAMFKGEKINSTEKRAVLHTALRGAASQYDFEVDGLNVGKAVSEEKRRFLSIADSVRSGEWKGFTGKRITDIVNIGIGGSDLGPAMAYLALSPADSPVRCHFVSNIDGQHIGSVLNNVNSETSLFIIVSKTFTTQETLRNAETARQWFFTHGGNQEAVSKHFIAVSTNAEKVKQFGIDVNRGMVGFWEWVGGRYSVWSAVGLSLAMAIGSEAFEQFLTGARAVDEHFRSTPLESNIPVLMALLSLWYVDFFKAQSHAILPYEQALARFPAYLQQLEMESNGKSCTLKGDSVTRPTCPVIWGEPGTNGQHAFYQLLHQGTVFVPCDFMAGRHPRDASIGGNADLAVEHHKMLLSNFLAQSRALMLGRPSGAQVPPPKQFSGNRPSTSILYDRLTPATLGALIALYEHKVFVLGCLWNINSFDQFGVELGKEMAGELLPLLTGSGDTANLDSSTRNLLQFIHGNIQ